MATLEQSGPLTLADVDFNRRDHEDRPMRPIPPARDHFARRWLPSRDFLFGDWRRIEPTIGASDFTPGPR